MDLEDEDIKKGIQELYNVDLMCPYCNEIVDVFNNDLQFSIDLHSQNELHKSAYTLFHENNLTGVDKSQEILDPKQQNSFIINSILSSITNEEPLKPVMFEDDKDTNDSFDESVQNISSIAKKQTSNLKTLFMQLHKGYVYNITLISKTKNRLYCKLCACVIGNADDDDETLVSKLVKHLDGLHQKQFLKKVLNLFPKKPVEDEDFFSLYRDVIICKLCRTVIPVTISGFKSTFYNMFLHTNGKKHSTNMIRHLKDYQELKQLFNNQLPRTLESNKYYIIRNGVNFECVICKTNIPVSERTTQQMLQSFSEHFCNNSHKQNLPINKILYNKKGSDSVNISNHEYLSSKIYPYNSPVIEQNKKHIIRDGSHFKCILCDKQLQISPEPSITVSVFSQHLKSFSHKEKLKIKNNQNNLSNKPDSTKIKQNKKMQEFIDDFKHLEKLLFPFPVPQIITNNKEYMIKQGNNFLCTLCNVQLIVCSDPANTILQFSYHLKSVLHKKRFKILTKHNSNTIISNSQTNPKSSTIKNNNHLETLVSSSNSTNGDDLTRLLDPLPLPKLLCDNRMYLINEGDHFKCTICNAQLMVSSEPSITISTFSQHLNGCSHSKNLQTINKNLIFNNLREMTYKTPNTVSSSSDDFEYLKALVYPLVIPQILEENKKFIMKDDRHFKCALCCVNLTLCSKPENTIFQFSQHMKEHIHWENLQLWNSLPSQIKENSHFLFKNSLNFSSYNDKQEYFDSMQTYNPTIFEDIIKPNMQFIQFKDENRFTCTLCAINISVSSDPENMISQLYEHANGKQHKTNISLSALKNILVKNANNDEELCLNLKTELDSSLIPDILELNKKFLINDGHRVKCTLCDVALTASADAHKTVTQISQHLRGSLHSSKLKSNNIRLMETSVVHLQQTNLLNKKEKVVQSLMEIFHPFTIPQIIIENKMHIVKYNEHFKCVLCNEILQVSKYAENSILSFMSHFMSIEHNNRNSYVQHSELDESVIQRFSCMGATNISFDTEKPLVNQNYESHTDAAQCLVCNESLDICWSDTKKATTQIVDHFQSKSHKKNATKRSELDKGPKMSVENDLSDFETLTNALNPHPIPNVLESNKQYIAKENNYFKCILCNIKMSLCSSPSKTIFQFSQHLNCAHHKRLVKCNKILTSVMPSVEDVSLQLNKILHPLPIPKIVIENKDFLNVDESYLKCTLCKVQFSIIAPSKLLYSLSQHLDSRRHKKEHQKLKIDPLVFVDPQKKLKVSLITDIDSLKNIIHPIKIPLIVEENKIYIKKIKGNFQCILCKAQFNISSNVSSMIHNMSHHVQSKKHIKKLANANLSNTSINGTNTNLTHSMKASDTVLQGLVDVLKINTVPDVFMRNKEYIHKLGNGYQCSLCKVQLCVTQSAPSTITLFSQHFDSKKHFKKVSFIKDNAPPEIVNHVLFQDDSTVSGLSNEKSRTTFPTYSSSPSLIMFEGIRKHLKDVMFPYDIPQIIELNMTYLLHNSQGYICSACNVQIIITQKPYSTILNFCQHLSSNNHIANTSIYK